MNELENLTTAERNALQEALKENREHMSVNEVKEMLLRTEKGAVKSTIGNCLIVLQNDPYLTGALAYNLLAVKTYIVKPLWYQRPEGSALNDTDLAYIRLYMERNVSDIVCIIFWEPTLMSSIMRYSNYFCWVLFTGHFIRDANLMLCFAW